MSSGASWRDYQWWLGTTAASVTLGAGFGVAVYSVGAGWIASGAVFVVVWVIAAAKLMQMTDRDSGGRCVKCAPVARQSFP